LEKSCNIAAVSGDQPPNPIGLRQMEAPLPEPRIASTDIALSSMLLVLNAYHYFEKLQKLKQQMFCLCFFRSLTPIFHFELCSLLVEGRKYFLSPARGFLTTQLPAETCKFLILKWNVLIDLRINLMLVCKHGPLLSNANQVKY